MIKLSPSILACDFNILGEQVAKAEASGAEYMHLDVMDGLFVPSISLGMPVISSLKKTSKAVFDTHLMINEPIRYIEEFVKAGSDIITVHVEACNDVVATLNKIKSFGIKAGVVINPETPVSTILPYIDMVDMILLMSVHPGFGGQSYIDEVTPKIIETRKLINASGRNIELEVDGGVKISNVNTVLEAGADVIVAGSAVFGGDINANVKGFLSAFENFERAK